MMNLFHHSKARMPVIVFLAVVSCFSNSILAQSTAYIDSLLAALTTAKEDSSKVKLLCELGAELGSKDADKGLSYAEQALQLAEKLAWRKGIALAHSEIGRCNWHKGSFDEALKHHFEALKLWQMEGNKNRIALIYAQIGQDYADSGNYPEALKYLSSSLKDYEALGNKYQQSYVHSVLAWIYGNLGMIPEELNHQYAFLKICEETGDRHGAAIAYCNLASTYEEQGQYEKAIKTYEQSLKFEMEVEDFYNLSNGYNYIGNCYNKMGKYAEALSNHFKALEIGQKIKNGNSKGSAYSYIGEVYQAQGKNADALNYFLLSVKEFESHENKHALATQYSKIGSSLTKLGRYDEAQKYFRDALSLNNELESIDEYKNYYKGIVQLDSATSKWKNAFDHYKRFVAARDSMYNEKNTRLTVQTRMQYEFDKKEALTKQEIQKQKLMRNGFMIGFAAVLVFAGIFFNQRNKIKKAKERSDELLLNILPAEVADELKEKGSADAKLIEEVTVLFSDFKDFTHMSEIQMPKDLVAEINECFSAFDRIMQKHGVEKIKTVGDAYLAAGGLPIPNATHAVDVLNAALEMQTFMQERKRQREAEGGFFFEARIGVHTGPVVAGIVGVKKFAYDIWGDTVNTAQRMESASEAGRINISESTFEQVKNQFNCTYRGKVETKGKGEVDMYFVEKMVLEMV
ncbi:MAG: tetratricopeptide repeat protein [Bacteroidetes bacterium]|nr:tetratricopeptide repeat protein [Bacteroidota bacterium]